MDDVTDDFGVELLTVLYSLLTNSRNVRSSFDANLPNAAMIVSRGIVVLVSIVVLVGRPRSSRRLLCLCCLSRCRRGCRRRRSSNKCLRLHRLRRRRCRRHRRRSNNNMSTHPSPTSPSSSS